MREVAFDSARNVSSANDGKTVDSESISQLELEEFTDPFNSTAQAVASVKQVLGEAGMTTAFLSR